MRSTSSSIRAAGYRPFKGDIETKELKEKTVCSGTNIKGESSAPEISGRERGNAAPSFVLPLLVVLLAFRGRLGKMCDRLQAQ